MRIACCAKTALIAGAIPVAELTPLPAHAVLSGLNPTWMLRGRFDVVESVFVEVLNRSGYRFLSFDNYAGGADCALSDLGETLITRRTLQGEFSVVRVSDTAVALIEHRRASASAEVAAVDRGSLKDAERVLQSALGTIHVPADQVQVTFWAQSQHGPRSERRRIHAPSWSEIETNYVRGAATRLEALMQSDPPEGGRLVLWHGPPGTGKTSALRALAREWEPWCSTHFVTDPEAFLGSGTSYLLDVLTAESPPVGDSPVDWKLVVLEDAGELLTADAHARTGQALSRLLNVTDGVLGQGMQVAVLVTTNEPLGRLHPAIQRAGRCWSQIEFPELPPEAANRWLERHGSTSRVEVSTGLADLFGRLRGQDAPERPRFGFAATNTG